MSGLKYYISKGQMVSLQREADRLKMDVNDLIKMRLEQSALDNGMVQGMQVALEQVLQRLQRCELMLMRFCELNEAELLDLGYLRGAIESQAGKNPDVAKRAEEIELRRMKFANKIREEVGQYLQ